MPALNPSAEAAAAVAAARAAASLGVTEAKTAYQLTTQVLKGDVELVVPLIALSVAAITAGFVVYTEEQAAAVSIDAAVALEASAAQAIVQAEWNAAVDRRRKEPPL